MSDWYWPDGTPMKDSDVSAWSRRETGGTWDSEHIETVVPGGKVSTIWLGLDHSYGDGAPLIFESMVFADGPMDQHCERYSTREQARRGHKELIRKVTAERKAWFELCVDERVAECALVVAEALAKHVQEHAGIDYGWAEQFDALVTAVTS